MFGRKDNPKGFSFIALYTFCQFCIRLNYMNLQCWKVKKLLNIGNIKPPTNFAKLNTQCWLTTDIKAGSGWDSFVLWLFTNLCHLNLALTSC